MPQSFLERLEHPPILCDGALGTELYARGAATFDCCMDELNVTAPDLVRSVHLDYISAGAEIIETNTFGANALRLATYGLEDRVQEINAQGVALAQDARCLTGQMVWVGGAVGPLGKKLAPLLGPVTRSQAREAFRQQVASLAEAGIDLIILETFTDLEEIREAALAAREACSLPLLAQMTLTGESRTAMEVAPVEIVHALEDLGVDVIGLNCGVGPQPMLDAIGEMTRVSHKPLSAQPNAGVPDYVGGRFIYRTSPESMAEQARRMAEMGVAIIGGCCGTTPAYLAKIRDAIQGMRRGRKPAVPSALGQEADPAPPTPVTPPATTL